MSKTAHPTVPMLSFLIRSRSFLNNRCNDEKTQLKLEVGALEAQNSREEAAHQEESAAQSVAYAKLSTAAGKQAETIDRLHYLLRSFWDGLGQHMTDFKYHGPVTLAFDVLVETKEILGIESPVAKKEEDPDDGA